MSDERFEEIRREFNEALPDLTAGKPDRSDLMVPLERILNPTEICMDECLEAISEVTGQTSLQIKGPRQKSEISRARHMLYILISDLT